MRRGGGVVLVVVVVVLVVILTTGNVSSVGSLSRKGIGFVVVTFEKLARRVLVAVV